MKIALTGSSSTGKTTLAKELCTSDNIQHYITVDARKLMEKYNVKNLDNFTDNDYILFQNEIAILIITTALLESTQNYMRWLLIK